MIRNELKLDVGYGEFFCSWCKKDTAIAETIEIVGSLSHSITCKHCGRSVKLYMR